MLYFIGLCILLLSLLAGIFNLVLHFWDMWKKRKETKKNLEKWRVNDQIALLKYFAEIKAALEAMDLKLAEGKLRDAKSFQGLYSYTEEEKLKIDFYRAQLDSYYDRGWLIGHWFRQVKVDPMTDTVHTSIFTMSNDRYHDHQFTIYFEDNKFAYVGESTGELGRELCWRIDNCQPICGFRSSMNHCVFNNIGYQWNANLEALKKGTVLKIAYDNNHANPRIYNIAQLTEALIKAEL